jgi:hypothetical protein
MVRSIMIRLSSCWGAKMGDELGTEFSAACNKLRWVLQEKTGDGRLRDLKTWLDYDSKSVSSLLYGATMRPR